MSEALLASWTSMGYLVPFTQMPSLRISRDTSTGFLYSGMFSLITLMFRSCLEMQKTGVPKPGLFSNSPEGKFMTAVSPSEMNDFALPDRSSIRLRLKPAPRPPDRTLSPSRSATGLLKRTTALDPRTLSMVPTLMPL